MQSQPKRQKLSLSEKVARQHQVVSENKLEPAYSFSKPVEELTPAQQRNIWHQWYGNKSKAKCVICDSVTVYNRTAGYDRSHIVARAINGLNSVCYNRIATCRTCNSEDRTNNLLDYLYVNYRANLLPVCRRLFEIYCRERPHLAEYLDEISLSKFIKRVYSRNLQHSSEIAGTLEKLEKLSREYEQCLKVEQQLKRDEKMAHVEVQDAEKKLRLLRQHLEDQQSKSIDLQVKLERFSRGKQWGGSN